jgi:hypothetical protein
VSRTVETAMRAMTETSTNLLRGREGHGRSFIKAVSWRTVGTIDTFVISFFRHRQGEHPRQDRLHRGRDQNPDLLPA